MALFKISFRPLFHDILDFVYPPLCLSCKNTLGKNNRFLCPACWASIRVLSDNDTLLVETRQKLLSSGSVDGLISRYVFAEQGAFRELAHALKYEGFRSIGTILGGQLGDMIRQLRDQIDYLIPIPLHKAKQRERGFNQSLEICRGIASVSGYAIRADLLRRVRNTPSQTHLTAEERAENVKEAFIVPHKWRNELEKKSCLLVDDVVTTGATILSAAQALRKAGARSVSVAAVALAERPGNQ